MESEGRKCEYPAAANHHRTKSSPPRRRSRTTERVENSGHPPYDDPVEMEGAPPSEGYNIGTESPEMEEGPAANHSTAPRQSPIGHYEEATPIEHDSVEAMLDTPTV